MANNYQPKAEHKFVFGLWTLGNVDTVLNVKG